MLTPFSTESRDYSSLKKSSRKNPWGNPAFW